MTADDFRVEVIGHATLRVQCAGRTLLTDPWLIDPIACGSCFHFPPIVHDPRRLAAETDAIYISHLHPDHFHRPSLALFSRNTPIYIGSYRRKEFRERVRDLGFPVIEVPFESTVCVDGTPFRVALLEHDSDETAAYDSSVVIEAPGFTVFDNNDCFLRPCKYAWVRERFRIDYAFLGYSPASFFPISFEMGDREKSRLLDESSRRRYGDFIDAARLLGAGLAIPFASGLRFLSAAALWKNVSFNSATEAVRRLHASGLRGETLGPGDRICGDGSIRRVSNALECDEELAAIAAHARTVQPWVAALQDELPPARDDVVERFRGYILGLWCDTGATLPGVRRNVIAYTFLGPTEQRFYFDFSRAERHVFQWGDPPRYDMRYTYPANAVQAVLDGEIDWDQLHFTDMVSVHQINYARDFYKMLRSEMLDLSARDASV